MKAGLSPCGVTRTAEKKKLRPSGLLKTFAAPQMEVANIYGVVNGRLERRRRTKRKEGDVPSLSPVEVGGGSPVGVEAGGQDWL